MTQEQSTSEHKINRTVRKIFLAYILLMCSICGRCASVASVQVLSGSIPEFELNSWRFGTQVIVVLLFMIVNQKYNIAVPRSRWLHLCVIIITAFLFNVIYFLAAEYVPVGTLAGMSNAVFILSNALVTLCIREERRLHLYVSACLAIAGILMLTQPEFIFHQANSYHTSNWTSPCVAENVLPDWQDSKDIIYNNGTLLNSTMSETTLGYILVTIAGLCMMISVRLASKFVDVVSPFTLTFYIGLVPMVMCLILMLILETPVIPGNPLCALLLLVHAVGASKCTSNVQVHAGWGGSERVHVGDTHRWQVYY